VSVYILSADRTKEVGEKLDGWKGRRDIFAIYLAYTHIKNTHKHRHNYDINPYIAVPLLCGGRLEGERWRGEGQAW
jgi:hypothetical protein